MHFLKNGLNVLLSWETSVEDENEDISVFGRIGECGGEGYFESSVRLRARWYYAALSLSLSLPRSLSFCLTCHDCGHPSISEGFIWISQHWWTPLLNDSVCLPGWTCACACHWRAGEYLKMDSSEWDWNTSRSTALTLSLSVSPLCLCVGGSSPRRPALHLASMRLTEDNTFLPGR